MEKEVFKPIWMTTKDHLITFNEIVSKETWWRKYLLGRYKLPKGYPAFQLWYSKTPIVFQARGQLIINENQIQFKSTTSFLNFTMRNLKNVTLDIDKNQVDKLDRYEFISDFMKYYKFNWIEISLKNGENILLCHGANGPGIEAINRKTDVLFEKISNWCK